jgi:hypothetical protein
VLVHRALSIILHLDLLEPPDLLVTQHNNRAKLRLFLRPTSKDIKAKDLTKKSPTAKNPHTLTTPHSLSMAGNVKKTRGNAKGGNLFAVLGEVLDNEPASPTTDSSGDTLPEDGSSVAQSHGETATFSSPLSPSLDFSNLTISETGSRVFNGNNERYTAPFQRDITAQNDSNRFSNIGSNFVRKDNTFHNGSPFSGRAANFRNSRTWMSAEAQAQQEWMVIRNSMRRQFKNSNVAKWKHNDYIAHREAMIAAQATELANKLRAKEEALSLRIPPIPQDTQQNLHKWGLFGNFAQVGNFGCVLGEQTIWCHDWLNGKDEIAPWPSIAELKWEGDDRAKTGVGRFFPLPREEGPPGLSWNQLPIVDQYPIDQVARIPTMEDIYLPIDDKIEPEKGYLWSKDLEKTIDAYLKI